MFYKLRLQIQRIEGALYFKIAPLTPPNLHTLTKYIPMYLQSMYISIIVLSSIYLNYICGLVDLKQSVGWLWMKKKV